MTRHPEDPGVANSSPGTSSRRSLLVNAESAPQLRTSIANPGEGNTLAIRCLMMLMPSGIDKLRCRHGPSRPWPVQRLH